MDKDDGGSAFPVVGMQQRGDQQFVGVFANGMTLRDYFAARAITALVTLAGTRFSANKEQADDDARIAYQYADAMLKARANG